jgi:hypothetical protein
MYYHNSPTLKNIKLLKTSRAADMNDAIAGMKAISASYRNILKDLHKLREKELVADQLVARFPEKKDAIAKQMTHNYKIMENKLAKFLGDE